MSKLDIMANLISWQTVCREFYLGDNVFATEANKQKHWTLPEIVQRMRSAYCGTLAAEFMHLGSEWAQVSLQSSNWICSNWMKYIIQFSSKTTQANTRPHDNVMVQRTQKSSFKSSAWIYPSIRCLNSITAVPILTTVVYSNYTGFQKSRDTFEIQSAQYGLVYSSHSNWLLEKKTLENSNLYLQCFVVCAVILNRWLLEVDDSVVNLVLHLTRRYTILITHWHWQHIDFKVFTGRSSVGLLRDWKSQWPLVIATSNRYFTTW